MSKLLKTIVLSSIVMFLFSITTPAFAQESGNGLADKMNNLSTTDKQSITNHLKNSTRSQQKTARNYLKKTNKSPLGL